MSKRYVLGFCFNDDFSRVVLIEKQKPEWQKGRLNGVGGKIEPGEYPIHAMAREFKEETGVETSPDGWHYFCTLKGAEPWEVECFYYVSSTSCTTAATTTTEMVVKPWLPLNSNAYKSTLANVPWLIAMAQSMQGEMCTSFKVQEVVADE